MQLKQKEQEWNKKKKKWIIKQKEQEQIQTISVYSNPHQSSGQKFDYRQDKQKNINPYIDKKMQNKNVYYQKKQQKNQRLQYFVNTKAKNQTQEYKTQKRIIVEQQMKQKIKYIEKQKNDTIKDLKQIFENIKRPSQRPNFQQGNKQLTKIQRQENKKIEKTNDRKEKMSILYKKGNFNKSISTERNNIDRNPCQKYMWQAKQIEKQLGLQVQIRKIKRMLLERQQTATKIKIMQSQIYPMVYLDYECENQIYQKHIRNIIQNKKHDSNAVIGSVFQRLFNCVPQKYWGISAFALKYAKSKNIFLNFPLIGEKLFVGVESQIQSLKTRRTFKNLTNRYQKENNQPYFYYSYKKQLYFTLFDDNFFSMEFNFRDIHRFSEECPIAYGLYQQFLNQMEQQKQKRTGGINLLQNEQIDSDQQLKKQKKSKTLKTNSKDQLKILMSKDLNQIDALIERKNDEFNDIEDKTSNRAQHIGDQIEELRVNRNSYAQVMQNIESRFKNKDYTNEENFCYIAVKRLLIAERQLESKLPIVAKKRQIFQKLKKNNLVIIEGETGSGKSTQLPQLLCQYFQLFEKGLPVLVTQPRKLATRSLAERVAEEMGESVGGFVDYCASAQKKVHPAAKIIFKLDRIVLDELAEDPLLSKYSCLVIDEAHQRTLSIDILLGLVTDLLRQRKNLKVIITSASMDVELFENYFKEFAGKALKVSGRMHPVQIIYKNVANNSEGDSVNAVQQILNECVLKGPATMLPKCKGHVLIFCASLEEINRLTQIYLQYLNSKVFQVIALHGRVAPEEQQIAFAETNLHKIIFASRIAETAITIEGVKVVIDPGFDLELVYDQNSKISSMKKRKIGQSSAKQRAGRSGRTASGICFRLYSQADFRSRPLNKIPEIHNTALDILVLRLKSLQIEDVINFPYLEAPDRDALKTSLQIMKIIGALDEQTHITAIGRLLVRIPIEPFLSRAIVEALLCEQAFLNPKFRQDYVFQNLRDCNTRIAPAIIEILCILVNCSGLFYISFDQRQIGEELKFKKFSHEKGDFFFLHNIYIDFKAEKCKVKSGNRTSKHMYEWAKQNFLSLRTLKQALELETQIQKIIKDFNVGKGLENNILEAKTKLKECKSFQDVLLSCLTTSFCANLCKYSGDPDLGYTLLSQQQPIQIYGTSTLSLQGITPEWILCYDLTMNKEGRLYCQVAHQIQFQFLRYTVNPYIQQKYNLLRMEKCNPFYKKIQEKVPTRILLQFKKERIQQILYQKGVFTTINEQLNIISFYIRQEDQEYRLFLKTGREKNVKWILKQQKNKQMLSSQQIVKSMLQDKKKQESKVYFHNFIGSIFIELKQGFQVMKIETRSVQTVFEIQGLNSMQQNSLMLDWNEYLQISMEETNKLKIFTANKQERQTFFQYMSAIDKEVQNKIMWKQKIVDRRKKIPQATIELTFFAGKRCNKMFFKYNMQDALQKTYYDRQEEITLADKMKLLLVQCQNINYRQLQRLQQFHRQYIRRFNKKQSLSPRQVFNKIQRLQFVVSKKRNGINVYQGQFDQIQMRQLLQDLKDNQMIGLQFKMPQKISKFREPDLIESSRSIDYWITEIKKILQKVELTQQKYTLNVWGYYNDQNSNYKLILEFKQNEPLNRKMKQKNNHQIKMNVQLHAQIKCYDGVVFEKLKNRYDGRKGVLGTQKIHVRATYDQIMAVPAEQVFCALQKEFEYLKKAGEKVLEQIQDQYNLNVYFGFQPYNHSLKVYCDKLISLTEIQKRLKTLLKSSPKINQKISYKGKNLNKVKDILKQNEQEIIGKKQRFFSYSIDFGRRLIELTADYSTLQNIKYNISKLVSATKQQCQICCETLKSPYKLLNCAHEFCWQCVAEHIRSFRNPDKNLLRCMSQQCKSPIAIADVRTLLSEEQFQKICDLKVTLYVNEHLDKYICCTECENIFVIKQLKQNIDCQICGTWSCLKCKQSHRGYSCQDWKDKDNFQTYSKMGIKKCPKCRAFIQKNGGCQHITCINCKQHICWNCLKTFKSSEECYDHLAKKCGGIFANN